MPQRGSQPRVATRAPLAHRRAAVHVKAVAAPEAPKLAIAGDVSSLIGNTPMVYLGKISQGINGMAVHALEGAPQYTLRGQDCRQA